MSPDATSTRRSRSPSVSHELDHPHRASSPDASQTEIVSTTLHLVNATSKLVGLLPDPHALVSPHADKTRDASSRLPSEGDIENPQREEAVGSVNTPGKESATLSGQKGEELGNQGMSSGPASSTVSDHERSPSPTAPQIEREETAEKINVTQKEAEKINVTQKESEIHSEQIKEGPENRDIPPGATSSSPEVESNLFASGENRSRSPSSLGDEPAPTVHHVDGADHHRSNRWQSLWSTVNSVGQSVWHGFVNVWDNVSGSVKAIYNYLKPSNFSIFKDKNTSHADDQYQPLLSEEIGQSSSTSHDYTSHDSARSTPSSSSKWLSPLSAIKTWFANPAAKEPAKIE